VDALLSVLSIQLDNTITDAGLFTATSQVMYRRLCSVSMLTQALAADHHFGHRRHLARCAGLPQSGLCLFGAVSLTLLLVS
jgi:hypothetical protein